MAPRCFHRMPDLRTKPVFLYKQTDASSAVYGRGDQQRISKDKVC